MIWFFLAVVAALCILGGLYWRWSRRTEAEIAEGAEIEWAQLSAGSPDLVADLDRPAFDAIHHRVNFPRFPGYALATLAAFFLSLPVSFALLAGGLWMMDSTGVAPQSADIANRYLIEGDRMRVVSAAPSEAAQYYVQDLAGFYYFFGVLVIWILIVAFFTRRYHARRPGYLRDEILRSR